ncbi:hypothetical protein CEXT_202041 [Caerostris extrusa]|uniref:Uncharacterized protein n=1 Tax=Caerostris extrusa TaxID=172846 RepID=A0AAV4MFD6_CAEEX|nr:hypothetical protein CEXT_202041 [Caerostris extrusa]
MFCLPTAIIPQHNETDEYAERNPLVRPFRLTSVFEAYGEKQNERSRVRISRVLLHFMNSVRCKANIGLPDSDC